MNTLTNAVGTGTYFTIFHSGVFVMDDFGNLVHFGLYDWLYNTGATSYK